MRKRILALMLMLALAFNINIVSVMASDGRIYPDSSYTQSLTGGEFDVSFRISSPKAIPVYDFRISYDPNIIQMVETSASSTSGYYCTESGNRFITASSINNNLKLVPSVNPVNNGVFEGKEDGVKTEAELGYVRLAGNVYEEDGSFSTKGSDGEILMTLTFKPVGVGSTDIDIISCSNVLSKPILKEVVDFRTVEVDIDITPISVKITGEKATTTTTTTTEKSTETTTTKSVTTTTEKSTETTTKASSSSEKSKTTTTKATTTTTTTTTETTTEATTVIAEVSTESATATEKEYAFNDIANYPWAVDAIESLASQGIVNGIGDGKFNPSANVKRADFIIMLVRAMGIEGTAESNFDDVPSDKYYANAVGLAKENGIASGNGDGTFSPESYISRQDMMVLTARAINISGTDTAVLDRFEDKDLISSYAVSSLASMVDADVVHGTGNNIEPKAFTTRAQSAVIIYNILNLSDSE